MANEIVKVGIANEGEITLLIDVVKEWKPEKISQFGDTVYFKSGEKFYSMKTLEFKQIFEL